MAPHASRIGERGALQIEPMIAAARLPCHGESRDNSSTFLTCSTPRSWLDCHSHVAQLMHDRSPNKNGRPLQRVTPSKNRGPPVRLLALDLIVGDGRRHGLSRVHIGPKHLMGNKPELLHLGKD